MNKYLIDMRRPIDWRLYEGNRDKEIELFIKAGLDKNQYKESRNNYDNPEYFYRRWVVTCEEETLSLLVLFGFIYVKRAR